MSSAFLHFTGFHSSFAMFKALLIALTLLVSPHVFAATTPQVELKTNMGTIVIELYPENAPATVENFIRYVKDGHYNGTIFHRVIPGFMIQGGGYSTAFAEKPTRGPIKNEAGNGIRNAVGMVSMARTADPHSATAQFFINVVDNVGLDFRAPTAQGYGYTPFGKVVKGMDVVHKIEKVPTGPQPPHANVPVKPVIIESARVL
jgi:peptidyl-prolyl cis-trans isomerase A (cyclophilin A)/peptidyl-prolyl cis-trans isomerase B (cyclophilin B)